MPKPIYTPEACTPAYQLDWSYCLFWRTPPADLSWFARLQAVLEGDHIRLLRHQFEEPNVSKFLISTRPAVAPLLIAQRVMSLGSLVPDHIHLTLGCQLEDSPEQIALSYMNNLAYVCGMKAVFKFSYFVGTFGEYDLGVIPRS